MTRIKFGEEVCVDKSVACFMVGRRHPFPRGWGSPEICSFFDLSRNLDASPCLVHTLKPTISVELIKSYILSTITTL